MVLQSVDTNARTYMAVLYLPMYGKLFALANGMKKVLLYVLV